MISTTTEPIASHWTDVPTEPTDCGRQDGTAADVSPLLARLVVADIEAPLVPFLAAAAAEMALVSGIAWRFSSDDPPVALLRIIAKVGLRVPHAGGPHTTRLLDQLR